MSVDGIYKITVKTPVGSQKGQIILHMNGDKLSGALYNGKESLEFTEGKVTGNDYEFTVHMKGPIGMLNIYVKGKVEGKVITGFSKTPFGNMSLEGIKMEDS